MSFCRFWTRATSCDAGWSLTRDETGKIVRSSASLRRGSRLVTTFAEGSAVSVVDEVLDPAAPDPPESGEAFGEEGGPT